MDLDTSAARRNGQHHDPDAWRRAQEAGEKSLREFWAQQTTGATAGQLQQAFEADYTASLPGDRTIYPKYQEIDDQARALLAASARKRTRGAPPKADQSLADRTLQLLEQYKLLDQTNKLLEQVTDNSPPTVVDRDIPLPPSLLELIGRVLTMSCQKHAVPKPSKQRQIIESDARNIVPPATLAKTLDCSARYIYKFRNSPEYAPQLQQEITRLLADKLTKRLGESDPTPVRKQSPTYDDLLDEARNRLETIPIRSAIDQQLYSDLRTYVEHMVRNELTFAPPQSAGPEPASPPPRNLSRASTRERGPALDPPAEPITALYLRILGSSRRALRRGSEGPSPVFFFDEAAGVERVAIPIDILSIVVKTVDEDIKKRWPRQYQAFRAAAKSRAANSAHNTNGPGNPAGAA
jgi:hypothetical protein